MTIIYPIDDFLFALFGNADSSSKDSEAIKAQLHSYFTRMGINANVSIRDNVAIVDINDKKRSEKNESFNKAIELCNRHDFEAAKRLLIEHLKNNPTHSEAHRLLGQIFAEEGNFDKAQDELIEALRLNPKNDSALIMMGNILSNYHRDAKSAQKYFEQANQVKPDNHIILNNLGGNLLKLNQLEKAKEYLTQAIRVNPQYANTHYALAIVAEKEGDLASCFYSAVNAAKFAANNQSLREQAIKLCFDICPAIIQKSQNTRNILKDTLDELQNGFFTTIEFIEDEDIELPAILELAENHHRKEHVIRYKQSNPTEEYWRLHALMMLRLILTARRAGANKKFATTATTKAAFLNSVSENKRYLATQGLDDARIEQIMEAVYHGVAQVIYNTCIDLFVEDEINREFPDFRPHQFVSMHANLNGSIESITNENVARHSPQNILSVTRVYALIKALHLRDLYGIDLIDELRASETEKATANAMFNEFTEYRGDAQAGDEYKLLVSWAEAQGIRQFFELVNDPTNGLNKPHSSTNDPDAEMAKFQKKAAAMGLNMAVVMYMVDALDYFVNKDAETIKKIALEIAMVGMNGIRPEQQGYAIKSISGKTFSGYHLLAYYYVSFALVLPEMLNELKLPYDKEYAFALKMQTK